MSMDTSRLAFPKAEPRKLTKARKERAEARTKKSVRELCVHRDGWCRIFKERFESRSNSSPVVTMLLVGCSGLGEWAHMHMKRRSKTRGQAPDIRHTTKDSLMLCQTHHDQYDAHRLRITALTRKGADGPLKFTRAKT